MEVVPDRGGECEDALEDADDHPCWGVAAVGFEVELAFEGGVDRFDDLTQGVEEAGSGSFGFAHLRDPVPRVVAVGVDAVLAMSREFERLAT